MPALPSEPACSNPVLSQQTRAVSPNKAVRPVPWTPLLRNRFLRAKGKLMASDQHGSVLQRMLIHPAQPGKPLLQSPLSEGRGWCFSYREGLQFQLRQEFLFQRTAANAATEEQRRGCFQLAEKVFRR